MMGVQRFMLAAICCGPLVCGGCVVAGDLVNPDFAAALGLDSSVLRPGSGTVIVAFTNSTSFPAEITVAVSSDPGDPTANAQTIAVPLDEPGETRNIVLDCPVGVITPGVPHADFSTNSVAAVVFSGGGVQVTYTGAALVAGSQFSCGDVIEIELRQTGTGTGEQQTNQFSFRVTVIPGR